MLTACGGSSASDAGSPGSTGPRLTVVPAAVPVDASAGCTATPVVPPGQSKVPFTSGTDTAFYLRNVPPAPVAPTPAPLVMDLHGWSSTADIQVQTTGFETLGDTKGFVTITPESANAERVFDATLGGTALTYLGAVLDDAERTLCIDQNRVFVAGYSQGAIVTSSMACQFADRVAAVATVAGITDPDGCDAGPPGAGHRLPRHRRPVRGLRRLRGREDPRPEGPGRLGPDAAPSSASTPPPRWAPPSPTRRRPGPPATAATPRPRPRPRYRRT